MDGWNSVVRIPDASPVENCVSAYKAIYIHDPPEYTMIKIQRFPELLEN